MPDNEINFFAETTFRNQRKKFGIKIDDRRRHVYVIGKTGMGKTNMVENMAIQDIQAGRGVGFIDPHGEAAENILDFIPADRVNDVVYFNPADIENPVAFNVMEQIDPEHRHLVAAGLMGVFKKIWPDVWSARMEYILNNTILALLEYPNSTLLGVNRMLSDIEFRRKVVDKVTDPMVKSFWTQEFAKYTQRLEVEATAAIQNKVGQFISNPLIRNIIGQVKSTVDMREIMDGGKILIANISKGRIGEDNSRLLGALVITKLQLAAMSRVDTPEEKRRDFYLYVDEFQNFATESFCNILSEARKYRLDLTLGNQYIAQLDEMTASGRSTQVRDAVFGNVGTMICFRVGAEDAEFLEKEFMPEFVAADFVNLGKYNIYVKLMIDGLSCRPFSAQTLPPFPNPEKSNRESIIKVSRERYGTPQKIIEDKISKWIGVQDDSAPAQRQQQRQDQRQPQRQDQRAPSQSVLYDAQCAMCKKWTKVIFPPDGKRPVYCKVCLKKVEAEREGQKAPAPMPIQAQPAQVVKPQQSPAPTISLEEALKKEPASFTPSKKPREERPKRKEVDIDELKKILDKALDKNNEEAKGV
ncbi:MAG: type IV secretion system DNA-binding domain-containing protein [Candidatus Paceibacterota bacterium]